MARRLQLRRLVLLGLLLGAAFGGLSYRLIDLQVLRHAALTAKAQQYTHREFLIEPRRGDILDIKGNLLATSMPARTVCADPALIGNRQAEIAHVVAPLLQISESEVLQKLGSHIRQTDEGAPLTNHYVVLKRKVPLEVWQKLQATMNRISFGVGEKKLSLADRTFYRNLRQKAIYTDPVEDQLRVYRNQALAAHVLGCVGMEEHDANGVRVQETVGKEGIELTFNSKLEGVRGWRVTEKDQRQREVVPMRQQDVEPRRVAFKFEVVPSHISRLGQDVGAGPLFAQESVDEARFAGFDLAN